MKDREKKEKAGKRGESVKAKSDRKTGELSKISYKNRSEVNLLNSEEGKAKGVRKNEEKREKKSEIFIGKQKDAKERD